MSNRKGGFRDSTQNIKKFRLLITLPGQRARVFTSPSKKVLRTERKRQQALGARVEVQEHEVFETYRTVHVYEPTAPQGSAE